MRALEKFFVADWEKCTYFFSTPDLPENIASIVPIAVMACALNVFGDF